MFIEVILFIIVYLSITFVYNQNTNKGYELHNIACEDGYCLSKDGIVCEIDKIVINNTKYNYIVIKKSDIFGNIHYSNLAFKEDISNFKLKEDKKYEVSYKYIEEIETESDRIDIVEIHSTHKIIKGIDDVLLIFIFFIIPLEVLITIIATVIFIISKFRCKIK